MTITPDSSTHTIPALDKPEPRGSYVDPLYGSVITRLTDSASAPDNALGSGFLNTITPEYPSVCPWSLNNTWLVLLHFSYFGLYTGDGIYVRDLPFAISATSEPRWSRTNDSLLYYHAVGGNALLSYNVVTSVTTTVHTFSEYTTISGKGEMDTTGIGDLLVLEGNGTEAFVYDILNNTKSPVASIGSSLDSLHIAPDGSRFTITETGVIIEFLTATGASLSPTPLCQSGSHMDVAAFGGNQYLIRTNSNDPSPLSGYPNAIEMVNMSGGVRTGLLSLPWSESVHVSASDVGSVIVETYAAIGTTWDAYMNEILVISLDGLTTKRVAQHRSAVAGYSSMPLTTVRRDGKYAVFASNWGNATDAMDTYLILLGSSSTPLVPSAIPLAPAPSTTNFLRFDETQANVETDGEYTADSIRTGGVAAGDIVTSALANKFAMQASYFIAALAEALRLKGISSSDAVWADLVAALSNLRTAVEKVLFSDLSGGTFQVPEGVRFVPQDFESPGLSLAGIRSLKYIDAYTSTGLYLGKIPIV